MKLFFVLFAFVLSVKGTSKPSGIYFDNGKIRKKKKKKNIWRHSFKIKGGGVNGGFW